MPAITSDSALAVVPFFVPLLIFVCFATFVFAQHLRQAERRLEVLEGRIAAGTSYRVSPFIARLPHGRGQSRPVNSV